MKNIRIGLLGGMSGESTIKYYDLFLQKYYQKYKDYNYPEIVIFSLNFQKIIDYELINDKNNYIEYLMSGLKSLENAGTDFCLMTANSPHNVYEDLQKLSKIPILSIVEATANEAKKNNMKKVLLFGIKYTMQSSFYQNHFKMMNIDVITPTTKEQDEIDRIVFDELVINNFKDESKEKLLKIIRNYEVDGVILGCTELPLILKQKDTNVKLLDTVELHVNAALVYYYSLL